MNSSQAPVIRSIDHANLVVRDMELSLRFYRDILGFRETTRALLEGDWIATITGLPGAVADVVILEAPDGGARLELLQYISPEGTPVSHHNLPQGLGLRHLAFQVENIEEHVAHLRNAGISFVSDPVEVPAASVTFDRPVRKRLCYFYGPDEVLLELAEYR